MKKHGCDFFLSKYTKSSENVWNHEKDDREISPKSEQKTIRRNFFFNYRGARPPYFLVFLGDFVPTSGTGTSNPHALGERQSIQVNRFSCFTG